MPTRSSRDPDAPITIYHIGDEDSRTKWWDLCAGPHVEHTGMLPPDAIQLESIAGAYWRGDETRLMLQRIYATAWETKEQLEEYAPGHTQCPPPSVCTQHSMPLIAAHCVCYRFEAGPRGGRAKCVCKGGEGASRFVNYRHDVARCASVVVSNARAYE